MSLQHAANHLAAQGRGGDTTLVHMAPGEVKSLQQLAMAHGGSLSINPNTGLPEAGFLQSLLPAVIGAGLAAATGGTSLALEPGMIGLGVGGLQALQTGSLSKGLMAGLGAYGGAGLAGGLMASGAQQIAGDTIAKQAAENAALEGTTLPQNYAEIAGRTSLPQEQALARMGTSNLDLMGKGLTGGLSNFQSGMAAAGGPSLFKASFAALAPALTEQQGNLPTKQKEDADLGPRYRYEPGVASPFPQASPTGVERNYYPNAGYQRITDAQARELYGFADGGNVQGDPNLMQVKTFDPVVRMARGGRMFPAADNEPMQKPKGLRDMPGLRETKGLYASGGLSDLGGYSDGGRLLRGPGDGVSDSIPAVIGKKQPARLADGEFVVPARIVSEIGNGSTEAGARKLYAMMDRVQNARGKTVGKGKVAKNTRADKYLPA